MEIEYGNLVIEVTRRCNMACAHCLRGDAQDIDIDDAIIAKTLEHAVSIDCLTFTGGEPSLNVPAMRRTLDLMKEKEIELRGYFIATNGKTVTDGFIRFLIDLHAYVLACNGGYIEEGSCGVALSADEFHEPVPTGNEYMLRSLAAYSDVKRRSYAHGRTMLLNRGRARMLDGFETTEPFTSSDPCISETDRGFRAEETIMITAAGNVVTDCDYEYGNEAYETIGSLDDSDMPHIMAEFIGVDIDAMGNCA